MEKCKEIYRGYTITVEQDEDPLSPDEFRGENTFLFSHHRSFTISPRKDITDNIKNWKNYHKIPLYAYIHSGISLSLRNDIYPFNDKWDAGQIGNVFVKKSRRKGYNFQEIAQNYIDAWNAYNAGEVWVYIIEDAQGEHVETCSGFYGDYKNALQWGKDTVDILLLNEQEEKERAL